MIVWEWKGWKHTDWWFWGWKNYNINEVGKWEEKFWNLELEREIRSENNKSNTVVVQNKHQNFFKKIWNFFLLNNILQQWNRRQRTVARLFQPLDLRLAMVNGGDFHFLGANFEHGPDWIVEPFDIWMGAFIGGVDEVEGQDDITAVNKEIGETVLKASLDIGVGLFLKL